MEVSVWAKEYKEDKYREISDCINRTITNVFCLHLLLIGR